MCTSLGQQRSTLQKETKPQLVCRIAPCLALQSRPRCEPKRWWMGSGCPLWPSMRRQVPRLQVRGQGECTKRGWKCIAAMPVCSRGGTLDLFHCRASGDGSQQSARAHITILIVTRLASPAGRAAVLQSEAPARRPGGHCLAFATMLLGCLPAFDTLGTHGAPHSPALLTAAAAC